MKALVSIFICFLAFPAMAKTSDYAEREEVQAFIREVAARHGFVERELRHLFSRVRRAEPVLEAIKPPPPKARSWEEYRGNFVNERRIAGGVEFWKKHRDAEGPLRLWFSQVEKLDWKGPADVRATFGTADFVANDRIVFDIAARKLNVELTRKELKARLSKWKPPVPRYTAGVMAKYARHVSSASEGAVTD